MSAEPKVDLRVLVVDDEDDSRELLALVLERVVSTIEIAASAREAFEKIVAAPPDLLVSDISMPGEDGWSLVRRVRSLPRERGGTIAAFAVTALATDADVERSRAAGFDLVLTKPIQHRMLSAAVRAAATLREPPRTHPLARRLRLLATTSHVRIEHARRRDHMTRMVVARGSRISYEAERAILRSHELLRR